MSVVDYDAYGDSYGLLHYVFPYVFKDRSMTHSGIVYSPSSSTTKA